MRDTPEHSDRFIAKNRRPARLTGPLTIAGIVMFGLSMFVLLARAPSSSDPAPADAKFAVPARELRVVALDLKNLEADRAIETIKSANADIVLLQGVPTADVARIGQAIGMSRANEKTGDVFYPAQNLAGPTAPFGNAIYSRFPLYEGRSIPNRGGSFGVWAVALIDGTKIMVASMQPSDTSSQVLGTRSADEVREKELSMLVRAHEELGRPPIIIGSRSALVQFGKPIAFDDVLIYAPRWTLKRDGGVAIAKPQ